MLTRSSFFTDQRQTQKFQRPLSLIPECGLCGLHKGCLSPKMEVDGKGEKKILLIAEAPGAMEDRQGKPLVGDTGQYLERILTRCGIRMRRDCWMINSLSCRPSRNAAPTKKQVSYCLPKVIKHIQDLNPETIILLGGASIKSALGWIWKEQVGKVGRWVGWEIPCQKLNCWIFPVYHPSHIWRSKDYRGRIDSLLEGLFEKCLRKAVSKSGRPFTEVPDYKSEVQISYRPLQTTQYLHAMTQMPRPIAFDFETDGLKPDGDDAPEIVTCAVSNGLYTIAFPWEGEVVRKMKELLLAPVPKIGANIKYEDRFIRRYLGIEVNNWIFDTMVAAHVLDNRSGVCGLKFQSFVRLGQAPYDTYISSYLRSETKGGYVRNRVREAPLETLLTYNGMDALLTWKLAHVQAQDLSINLYEENSNGQNGGSPSRVRL